MSSKVPKAIITVLLIGGLLVCAFIGFINGFEYVRSQNERISNLQDIYNEKGEGPVKQDTPGAVEVSLPRGADVDEIANILKDKGLIENTFAFKIISKFNGFDGQYQSGTHYLTKDLSYDEIMYILTHAPEAIMVTIPEGFTYKQMQERLIEAGLNIDVDYMDELVQKPNEFIDYSFVRDMEVHEDRKWLLQGYLWPDTYSFDAGMNEEDIIRVFLNNTRAKLSNELYQNRAKEIGLTMDQVITLASITQAEGVNSEMYKISRVFLNRLNNNMKLESCATINYLRMENGEEPTFWVNQSDLERFKDNPYNTYSFENLPPGPINNPGLAAIEGVLWPATEKTWDNAYSYYYFCADGKGHNVFSQTAEEHQKNIDHYRSETPEDQADHGQNKSDEGRDQNP